MTCSAPLRLGNMRYDPGGLVVLDVIDCEVIPVGDGIDPRYIENLPCLASGFGQ